MEIEWATFVESASGEGIGLVIKGPGADNLKAKWLPVEAKMWAVVSLRSDYHELGGTEPNVLRAEVREPSQRIVVNWMNWTMGSPQIRSAEFQEGHSGREIRPIQIEFPAQTAGWYEVELSLNGKSSYLLHLRVTSEE